MFENWTQWHWVALAWGQLILAYIGYLVYLNRREAYLRRELRDLESGRQGRQEGSSSNA